MNPIVGLFVVAYAAVLVVWIRNRLLGRIALREGVRRPLQTLLVVGGLMVGSAGITAALVATDSAGDSSVLNVYRSWDRTDLLVDSGSKVFPMSVATDLANDPALAGKIDGMMGSIEAIGSVSDRTQKESASGVRLVGFDPAAQPAFGAFTLTDGTTTFGQDLGKREVIVSRQLAANLDIQPGDKLVMAMERLQQPKPSPEALGKRIKAKARRLQRLQKQLQGESQAAAKSAATAAVNAYLSQVQASLMAQAAAAQAAYVQQLQEYQNSLPPIPTPPPILPSPPPVPTPPPPLPSPPVIPPPPAPPVITPPDPTQIQTGAQAVGAAAAQQAAKEVARRFTPRLRGIGHEMKRLQNEIERTINQMKPVKLSVAGIAKSEGPGAYGLYTAVFAPLPLAQRISGADGINTVRISGTGDRYTGMDTAASALPVIQDKLASLSDSTGVDLEVLQGKRDSLKDARDGTRFILAMLVGMTFLVIAAGVALIINLTQMLAEERRPRLATLRALGLTRHGLIALSVLEGAFYSLLAAAAGVALGIQAGRVLSERFATAFAQFFGGQLDFVFIFSVRRSTLVTAFAAGALVTLGTMYVAAWRTSRLNIPAAIRNLPEPARDPRHRRWPRRAVNVALLVLAVPPLTGPEQTPRLIGGVLLIILLARLARGHVPERIYATTYGVMLAGWAFLNVAIANKEEDNPAKFFSMFVLAILVSVIGLALITSANLRVLERASAIFGPLTRRTRATLRVPLAYLTRRRSRTGLTIVMFGVVMAIIAMFSVMLFVFQPQYERDSNGYDIVVTKAGKDALKLPDAIRSQVARRVDVASKVYIGPFETQFVSAERFFAPLYQLSDEQFADPPARLSDRADGYPTDASVWAAVRSDPTKVVSSFGRTGDDITLKGKDGPVTFTVIGNPPGGLFDGLLGGEKTFAPFEDTARGQAILLDAKPGVDATALAKQIGSAKYKAGVTSKTTRGLLEAGYKATKTMFSVIDVLMRMGLVVGILSLGILALRAIVERKHLIGVMRAIGYHKRNVLFGLLLEAGLTATLGIAVGCAAGLAMGYIFYTLFFQEAVFGVLWHSLWNAFVLVYVAVLLVTIGPAWRASRLPPAEAVRWIE